MSCAGANRYTCADICADLFRECSTACREKNAQFGVTENVFGEVEGRPLRELAAELRKAGDAANAPYSSHSAVPSFVPGHYKDLEGV